ncbi:MAG: GGDEF domain-containing protein [Burkholderiales bacterium]|nr:GGDEF domain-containing protein [Burkholderiales bacterium]
MNPAFQPTAVLGALDPDWDPLPARAIPRALRLAGATLGMVALGLAIVATLAEANAALVAALALACAAVGSAALQAGTAAERRQAELRGWIDARSGLHNSMGLARAGDAMLAQSGGAGALVVLEFSDLLEVNEIYGRETSRKLQQRVVDRIRVLAGARGLAARTGRTQFAVLLPGHSQEKAEAAVKRVLGKPSRIEFDAGDSEIVLVPDILCRAVQPGDDSVGDLHLATSARMADQRSRELRRHREMQRQRERHSRPMSLPPSGH